MGRSSTKLRAMSARHRRSRCFQAQLSRMAHKRSLMLGNDGKEIRGADHLIARGRKRIRESAAYAARFHLAPGVEATITADGMSASGAGVAAAPLSVSALLPNAPPIRPRR